MNDILTRGVANIIPSRNELEKLLNSGQKLNVYFGIDPTATNIHLGHAVPLRKLQKLAELGHNVTFLIGDFTALVGDTSDKDSERPILTIKEIEENFQTYKKQAEKILDFSKIKVRHNSEWLAKLTYSEVFSIKQQFSLNDFISRELIKKRLSEGKSVRLDETEYPIMQGYDSYFMDTDIQIGGTDQTFNMQAGRTLQKKLRGKESYILATEFLMGTDGRKMSKSWGNAIWLTDEPFEMYRKVMAINDNQIKNYYLLGSNVPEADIPNEEEITKNPMEAKKKLAEAIVKELYSQEQAKKAQEEFERVVQDKQLPEGGFLTLEVRDRFTILESLGVLDYSRSEAKRLIEQGGVTLNGKKITDPHSKMEGGILRIGKSMIRKVQVVIE
ncbi:MAG: Tyrosine-tRNA ligase [Microgenomates group bacterium GW2011_GWA2_37_6]|nr:MAG: Tyrosine-tRNA ligase [Microgenomates group bacterium GW2011_GWA2_37_6]